MKNRKQNMIMWAIVSKDGEGKIHQILANRSEARMFKTEHHHVMKVKVTYEVVK